VLLLIAQQTPALKRLVNLASLRRVVLWAREEGLAEFSPEEARYRAPMDRLDLKCVCLRTRTWTPLEPHREKLLGDARQPCIRIVITYTDVSLSW
jgi:hypothetical protein